MRFRFRLDRLLQLRERKEQQQAEALGKALRDESERRAASAEADARLADAREQAAASPGSVTPAGALRNVSLTLDAAQRNSVSAAASQAQAEQVVDAERTRYGAAQRDRRVIERLKEKRLEDWTHQENRKEQQELDGLALDRHRRQGESQ